jgi:hypothetical protein
MDEQVGKLMVALGLALVEIHNPGAARAAGYDIMDVCEGVLKDAVKVNGEPLLIRKETVRRARAQA